MYIINQDRDKTILKTKSLTVRPITEGETVYSYGLYHGEDFLGDFDDRETADAECGRLNESTKDEEIVNGYFFSDECDDECEAEILEAVIKTWNAMYPHLDDIIDALDAGIEPTFLQICVSRLVEEAEADEMAD